MHTGILHRHVLAFRLIEYGTGFQSPPQFLAQQFLLLVQLFNHAFILGGSPRQVG